MRIIKKKILLVDDAQDMRSLIKCLLQPEGYEIIEAGNGQQALDILDRDSAPDLVLLDQQMPVMDGPQFLQIIEKNYPHIFKKVPIILLTGTALEEVPDTRATEVVIKPVKIETLQLILAKYLY